MPFNMFPYSNLHNINADWLLKTVKQAATDASQAESDAQAAQAAAEAAQEAAAGSAETVAGFEERLGLVEGELRYVGDALGTEVMDRKKDAAARPLLYIGTEPAPAVLNEQTRIMTLAQWNDPATYIPDLFITVSGWANAIRNASVVVEVSTGIICLMRVTAHVPTQETDGVYLVGTGKRLISDAATQTWVTAQISGKLNAANPEATGVLQISDATAAGIQLVDPTRGMVKAELNPVDRTINITAAWPSVPLNQAPVISGVGSPVNHQDAANKQYVDSKTPAAYTVSGSNPSITPVNNGVYTAGEVSTLTVTALPAAGSIFELIFYSGDTPTELILPGEVLLPDDFEVEADTIYDISIRSVAIGLVTYGLGAGQGWPA